MTFKMDTTTKPGSSGLHIAVDKATGTKPYLGDPDVINTLVRGLVSASTQRVGAVADGELERDAAVAADRDAVLQLADILAGKNGAFETVGDWNPHGLAASIRANMADSIDTAAAADDIDAIQQACALLLHETYEVLGQLAQDGDEQDATLSLEGITGDYTNLFAGLPVDGDAQETDQ